MERNYAMDYFGIYPEMLTIADNVIDACEQVYNISAASVYYRAELALIEKNVSNVSSKIVQALFSALKDALERENVVSSYNVNETDDTKFYICHNEELVEIHCAEDCPLPHFDTAEDLGEYLKKVLPKHLPDKFRDYEMVVKDIHIPNMVYVGLVLLKDGRSSAIINLNTINEFYCDGTFSEMIDAVIKEIKESPDVDITPLIDYNEAKPKLFIKLINAEWNKDVLKDIPHMTLEDLAVIPSICLKNDDGEVASVNIQNSMLERWNVTKLTVLTDAVRNSAKLFPGKVSNMSEYLPVPDSPMIVVSNERGINGASAIIYDGILEQVAERIGDDFYIIPSSIHEVICIPVSVQSAEELIKLVRFVNESEVMPKERLSDNAYRYHCDTGKITIA